MNPIPPAGQSFLAALSANNDGTWFEANREAFARGVLEPLRDLVVRI
jgi:uncharacterized protein (DUF2461 family)